MTAQKNLPSPPRPLRRVPRQNGFIIMLGLSFVLMALGSDFVPLAFGPLDYLGIPYPHVLRFTHIVMPASVFVIWIVSRRSVVVTVAAYMLACSAMTAVTRWAETQPARIPLTRWIDGVELTAAEQRLGFKITESGSKYGTFLLVARGNERAATDEVKRLGRYQPQGSGPEGSG